MIDAGYTFDKIANTGRVGCQECYEVFENKLDPIIKKIQGSNRHVGRIGNIIDKKIETKNKIEKKEKPENDNLPKIERLKEDLKDAIKEERYEDAAKIRDEINKIEK